MTKLDAIRANNDRLQKIPQTREKAIVELLKAEKDVAWLVETVDLLKLALAHQRYRNHEFKGSCDGCRLNADALARLEAPDGH